MEPARKPPQPPLPEIGPFRRSFWRSPLRGPWLASFLSAALGPLVLTCFATGLLSHAAYDTALGHNGLFDPGVNFYFFEWPTGPSWLYAFTQGVHIVSGLAAIPILLAKLWAVIPQLFERPAVRSMAHGLERLGLALLVGGSLFVFSTGILNIQLWYPFGFSFVPAHYYAAFVFIAALAFHVFTKITVARRAFSERGVVAPLRDDLAHTRPEPPLEGLETTAPVDAAPPTMSRRLLLGTVGAASVGLGLMGVGQTAGGPFRKLAFLAPRGDGPGDGPNAFQVNKTFKSVHIPRTSVGGDWRLSMSVDGFPRMTLSREELLAMSATTASLPIACVEGWSTTQRWTGVPISTLARMAEAEGRDLEVRSLQQSGTFRRTSLNQGQIQDERSLLALKVNGADLSLDHGFPARLIVPALPGVHNTKWVAELAFGAAA
jgi:DMSO/TMAO reductase YedYZ molybdopterin-dependent catalytic subunit